MDLLKIIHGQGCFPFFIILHNSISIFHSEDQQTYHSVQQELSQALTGVAVLLQTGLTPGGGADLTGGADGWLSPVPRQELYIQLLLHHSVALI